MSDTTMMAKIPERALLLLRGQYHQVEATQTEYDNAVRLVVAALGVDPTKVTAIRLEQGEIEYSE